MDPFIQNISLAAVVEGKHSFPGEDGVLIQIVDYDMDWPKPKFSFREIHQFKFLDVEGELTYEHGIKKQQADDIVQILKNAKRDGKNVIVHCVMGICRSGAVAEVGVMMGFHDTRVYRQPNVDVKKALLSSLGWSYNFPGESQ